MVKKVMNMMGSSGVTAIERAIAGFTSMKDKLNEAIEKTKADHDKEEQKIQGLLVEVQERKDSQEVMLKAMDKAKTVISNIDQFLGNS